MNVSDIEVALIDGVGSDLMVVNAARVSFEKTSEWEIVRESIYEEGQEVGYYDHRVLKDKDVRLIKYLAKHKHLSPFNHCFITFRVKAPIFVARQLVKHEYMPWNEVSRRYVDSEPEFYIPSEWRLKASDKKQGSSEAIHDNSAGIEIGVVEQASQMLEYYNWLLSEGVCPEQARMVLPLNVMTEWYWSGTLGAFAKMLKLRLDDDTQKETQIVAKRIYDELSPRFPHSIKALMEN